MKPASIISIIVSVLLIVAGLSTCIIAQNMANANGEALFSEMKDDNLVNSFDLTDTSFSKIELIVTDAEINVYGNSKTSYIEFVNFRDNYYTLSTANKALSFDEIPDMVSMLKFWENGFSFKGMRHVFNFKKDVDSKKAINVYLGSDQNIKIFNITADNCVLNLDNLATSSDYNINIDNGEINTTALKTASAFKVNGHSLKIHMKSAEFNTLEIKADQLEMTADSFRANGNASIEAVSGSIDLASPYKVDALNLDLDTVSGTVKINGSDVGYTFKQQNEADSGSINIITDTADISIRQNSIGGILPPSDTTPETADKASDTETESNE